MPEQDMFGRPDPPDLKVPPSLDGATYNPMIDGSRLGRQFLNVWHYMADGTWHTLFEIAANTGHPESSVSARIRDFRKDKFGAHIVERRRTNEFGGTWEYRLIKNNPDCPF